MIDIYFTITLMAIAAIVVFLLAVMHSAPWQMIVGYWAVLTAKNIYDYVKVCKRINKKTDDSRDK